MGMEILVFKNNGLLGDQGKETVLKVNPVPCLFVMPCGWI
jgi:hypothetical protein